MNESEWIIPFRGYNSSGAYNQNLLWRKGSFYVMDNHRAALWCWFQHIDVNEKYNLFHIDRHSDTLYSKMDVWKQFVPDLSNVSVEEYLAISYLEGEPDIKLFSWANYLSLFLECYSHLLDSLYFSTHGEGDIPKFIKTQNINKFSHIPLNIGNWIDSERHSWIFNIDVDYFSVVDDKNYIELFSDDFLRKMFEPIVEAFRNGRIDVITLSLSPECSGGWEKSLLMCQKICGYFDIDFNIV